MKNSLLKSKSKYKFIIIFLLFTGASFSQPSLTLTINDLLTWQSTTITPTNISTVPISNRVKSADYQTGNYLDTNARILYCPDGMNNFGPYIDSAHQFNLFNFSHWQYIDILCWFGGSASLPIIIPAKSWVDAAHKNGVKVIGTVFFAPTVYGGSQSQVQSFLQQDAFGNFDAAAKMIQIANYYNFDGWILNFETPVDAATGALASSFVSKLDSAYTGEVIWYDAMLQSGNISYQNRLNANNAYFFQHSTGLFTNYAWTSGTTVTNSHNYAVGLNLSPFNVYTGADMWPSRTAQPAFTNYTWIDRIFTSGVAKTSIALFATNFTYNYAPFSVFNNDSTDYANFYSTERKIFSGVDNDPFAADATWKGIGNYIAMRTTSLSFPFQSDFNTGHGFNYYHNGNILLSGSWSNISHQSPLPSWTFYTNGTVIDYDFNDAYSGGSSIAISAANAGTYSIPLFSTELITATNLLSVELALKSASLSIDSISIELKKKGNAASAFSIYHPALNGNWESILNNNIAVAVSDTIIAIVLNIHASGAFNINIGKINIDENSVNTAVLSGKDNLNSLLVYPNPSSGNTFVSYNGQEGGQLNVFDLKGSNILTKTIKKGETEKLQLPCNNVYTYEFKAGNKIEHGKFIVN